MARARRLVVADMPHHVTQRGNQKQRVFYDDMDRRVYLKHVRKYFRKYGLKTIAYCLMNNHVHFVAVPEEESSLANAFKCLSMKYAQYYNRKYFSSGHLWQGRYYSCVLGSAHLYRAVRYVERNPVRALLVKDAWEWQWSSAAYHVGGGSAQLPLEDFGLYLGHSRTEWREVLKQEEEENILSEIRKSTTKGQMFGMGSDPIIVN